MTILVYITTKNETEAKNIAFTLVQQKIVACVNILPKIQSIYLWENKINTNTEVALLMKTTEQRFYKLVSIVRTIHSYDTPCIIALPITLGDHTFLSWITNVTNTEG